MMMMFFRLCIRIRGGSWYYDGAHCKFDFNSKTYHLNYACDLGFRVCGRCF